MSKNRSVYVCPGCKTRTPFGTETEPPPRNCPGCGRQLGIPTQFGPNALLHLTCAACSFEFTDFDLPIWGPRPERFRCPRCRSGVPRPADG